MVVMKVLSAVFMCVVVLIAAGCKSVNEEEQADGPATSEVVPEEVKQEVAQEVAQEVKEEVQKKKEVQKVEKVEKVQKKQGNALRTFSSDRAARNNIAKNLKQMFILFFEYDQDEGSYPRDLKVLQEKGYTASLEELSSCSVNGQQKKFVYIPGLSSSSPSGAIIMHTPEPVNEKRYVLLNSGSVRTMTEADFQVEIKKQAGAQ